MRNLHKLFYKDYYTHKVQLGRERSMEGISYEFLTNENKAKNIQEKNSKILNHPNGVNQLLTKEAKLSRILNEACNSSHSFSLRTLYPGLITGVGIDHEAGVEGEFKLGVHFDYTYGMPVIYGSSVKGVLSSYFKDYTKMCLPNLSPEAIEDCFQDIFHGRKRNREKDKEEKPGYDNKSIYERDIFFDAVIEEKNDKDRILDSDNLCPHGSDPLKSPTPISFLKIAAGVKIQFRFKLIDTVIDGNTLLDVETKKQLFEKILMEMGIGAKTNVGYGQFEPNKKNRFIDK